MLLGPDEPGQEVYFEAGLTDEHLGVAALSDVLEIQGTRNSIQ